MYSKKEIEKNLLITTSSDMKAINRIINDSIAFLTKNELCSSANFKQIIREVLINAIDHGNKNEISKKVILNIEILDNENILVSVKDEGDGFDTNSINMSIPENIEKFRNRGMGIINALCDNVEFNDKGNEIKLYIALINETDFDTEETEDSIKIIPSGDISSSIYDKFLNLLISLVDKNKKNYIFDFSNVESCDSISIGLFLKFSKTVNKSDENCNLIIENISNEMKMLFDMTRLSKIYNIK